MPQSSGSPGSYIGVRTAPIPHACAPPMLQATRNWQSRAAQLRPITIALQQQAARINSQHVDQQLGRRCGSVQWKGVDDCPPMQRA